MSKENIGITLTASEWETLKDEVDEFIAQDIDDGFPNDETLIVTIHPDKSVDLRVNYTGTAYHRVKL